jgi:hypothetical protein
MLKTDIDLQNRPHEASRQTLPSVAGQDLAVSGPRNGYVVARQGALYAA